MAYTEVKKRNGNEYYYRAHSIRNGDKISKKRIYLGAGLKEYEISEKESQADKKLLFVNDNKIKKTIEEIRIKILPILKKNKVHKAGIFGSYAKGENRKHSDVDILIQPPKGMGLDFFTLERELGERLKKKVDLVTYKGIYHLLRKRILEEEKRIL